MRTVTDMAREAEIHVYPEFEKAFDRFAELVRADERERLINGVEMPEPDTHCFDSDTNQDVWSYSKEQLRETVAAAVARERESCAKVCEEYTGPDYDTVSDILAAAIRARGNT